MGLYDPLIEPASTIAPGNIQTKQVVTEQIELNEHTLDALSHEYTDTGITTVPSSKALFEAYSILNDYITSIDPHHVLYTDNTVVTLPLLPEAFTLPDWNTYFNWTIDNGQMVYTSNNISDNYIKVIPEILTHPGYYFFVIDVDRLDSGNITVMDTVTDNKDYVLSTITDTGIYYVEVKIQNSNTGIDLSNPISPYDATATDAHTIIFEARDVAYGQSIRINSIGVYRVTDRIRHYLTYYLQNNDNLELFKKEIRTIVTELENDLAKYEKTVNKVDNELTGHLNDPNAHSELLTLDALGAAAKKHTHTYAGKELIGVAPEIHTHVASECGAANEVHDHSDLYYTKKETYNKIVETIGELDTTSGSVLEHINDVSNLAFVTRGNPHGTTYNEVGAAPKVHNHDDLYVHPNQVTELVAEAVDSLNNAYSKQFEEHLQANNPHGITPNKIGAALAEHEHQQYIDEEQAKNVIFSTVQELLGELNTGSSGSGSIAPMAILQYTYGKYPDGDIKPASILTRPITPVIFPYIYHTDKSYYDYHSGIARTNTNTYNNNYKIQYAFNQNSRGCAFSATPSQVSPVLVEYEFHHRRRIIGYTIRSGYSLFENTNASRAVATFNIYADGKLVSSHNNATITSSSASLYEYVFRLPQQVEISSKVVDGVADPDPRFKLTTDDVQLGDYVKHIVTTITDTNTESLISYYKVTDVTKLTSAAGYTVVAEKDVPTIFNWNIKVFSIHVTGVTTTNTGAWTIKVIPLFDDVDENCVATKSGITYTYRSRRISTESGAKLDLSDYIAAGTTPLYLFLQTTSKTLEGQTQDQQVNKLTVSEFPYEYGYHREGLSLFMDAYASKNTHSKFGTLSASSTSSNNLAAYNIYNNNLDNSYITADGTSTLTFTHVIPDTVTPKITVKSTIDEDGVLIDGRFALTSSQVNVGDYVRNEITTVDADGNSILEYVMYEVKDTSKLNTTDGYGTVPLFDQLPEVSINNCQMYFGSDLFNNNGKTIVPSSIKLVATVKKLDTVTLSIKVGNEVRDIETNIATYEDTVLLDMQGYIPSSSSGPVWLTPNMSGAIGITKLVLTISNTTTNRVGITKFIPYLETKYYSIGTGTSEGDNSEFPLGRLDLVNGKYYHTGNVLGKDITIPLLDLGTTSNGITTYVVTNYFGTTKIDCKLIDYLGNNNYKQETDVVDINITNDQITIKVASLPEGYHCLSITRLW